MFSLVIYSIFKLIDFAIYGRMYVNSLVVVVIVAEVLVELYIFCKLKEPKPKKMFAAEPEFVSVEDKAKANSTYFYVNSIFETENPYVEGTVRYDAWNKINKKGGDR